MNKKHRVPKNLLFTGPLLLLHLPRAEPPLSPIGPQPLSPLLPPRGPRELAYVGSPSERVEQEARGGGEGQGWRPRS